MPDVWLPGATIDRGVNAGYNSGRSSMDRAVAHYTVGADSRGIAQRGYFHFLVHQDASREGGCTQYAEVDAVTWHAAGAGNPYGPGIEYERRVTGPPGPDGISEAEPLTANQIDWGRRLVEYLAEWGIPPVLYDGPRYGAGNWHGWVNHHDLDRDRSDGLTRAEWDLITGGAPPDDTEADDMQAQIYGPNSATVYITDGIFKRPLSGEDERGALGNMGLIKGDPLPVNQWFLDALIDVEDVDSRLE